MIISSQEAGRLSQLYTLSDIEKLLKVEVSEVNEWTNIPNTLKQAMFRGNLLPYEARAKGKTPMFTRQAIDNYIQYLTERPSQGGANSKYKMEKFHSLFGKKTDRLMAKLIGCSQNTVWRYRSDNGIQSTRALNDGRDRISSKTITMEELESLPLSVSEREEIKSRLENT